MAITNKLIITLLLLISIAFVHCLTFHVEVKEEFEPPQQEEQERTGRGPGGGSDEEWEEEPTENPYHFRKRSFKTWFRSKEGFMKTLPKFTKRSPFLFRGIENYRFWLMEMEPIKKRSLCLIIGMLIPCF
ncbi:Vicilin-like seed storage protein [Cardamine amara subsp. amara]|uniref:Vicilin-like seed storage protein n=1 Tax=Cardamine amara subsp. amara TaxID=228776 RepID=A0ABD0ZSG5_CARAN